MVHSPSKQQSDRRPPSRVRYEESHPTVTIRVDLATKEKLDALSASTEKSLTQLVLEALDLREREKRETSIPCSICQEPQVPEEMLHVCGDCVLAADVDGAVIGEQLMDAMEYEWA